MDKSKINVGIIGTGGIVSWGHMPAFGKIPEFAVTYFCSAIKSEMDQMAAKHQVTKTTMDYKEMLKDPTLDLIVVATPNFLHKEICLAAFAAGKDVLCEKPPAPTAAETKEMVEAAEKSGRVLMFGFCFRQMDNGQKLKKFVDAGHLGEIYYAKTGWLRQRGYPNKGSWFTQKAKSGGGPLVDIGPHCLDRALWIMGYPEPKSVFGATYQKLADSAVNPSMPFGAAETKKPICDVEDLAVAMVRFKNGATLMVEVSFAINQRDVPYYSDFMGTKAGAKIQLDKSLVIYGEEKAELTEMKLIIDEKFDPDVIYYRQLLELRRRMTQRDQMTAENRNYVTLMKIINGIYQSAETGKLVEL